MKHVVEFRVRLRVDDDGTPDADALRKALYRLLTKAHDDGTITPLDNESAVVEEWWVEHVQTAPDPDFAGQPVAG